MDRTGSIWVLTYGISPSIVYRGLGSRTKNLPSSNWDFLIVFEMFGHVSTDISVTELMLILPK